MTSPAQPVRSWPSTGVAKVPVSVVLVLAVLFAATTAGAAPPPTPLPWERKYIEEIPRTQQQYLDELVEACRDDLERGVRDNGAVGVPRIAVLGDSVQVQTRRPALADGAYRWMYATHCGERFGSALDSGRVADAVATRPDVLLIALGGNSFTENWQTRPDMLGPALEGLQRLLDATDSVPCRVIYDLPHVAPWYAGDEGDTWLALTREVNNAIWAAERRPGVHVAPWRDHVAWYWPAYLHDGLHLTRFGINEKLNLALRTAHQCLLPHSPANVGAVAGNGTATVWWDPLPDPEKVTSYVVTASDGRTVTTTGNTVNFPGLVNGTSYRFRVAAVNGKGAGPPSGWTGYVLPSAAGARFHATAPVRVLDTRDGTGGKASAFGPGQSHRLVLPAGVVPRGASAVVLNVTATGQTAPTFVTVWPGGQSRPLASNLNPAPGVEAVPAMVTTRVAADGSIQLFNNTGRVHLVADVVGWFGAPGNAAGSLFAPVAPVRVLDTRDGTGGPARPFGATEARPLTFDGLPADASAVVLNVTATSTTAPTHVTLWPAGQAEPLASSLNPQPGRTRANLTVVKLGTADAIHLRNNSGSTDLVADLVGYYTAEGATTGGAAYHPLTPERAYDTRDGTGGLTGPRGNGANTPLAFTGRGAVPATGVSAVDANLTVVEPSASGHTTVWPSGPRPNASILNYGAGDVVANRDQAALSVDGRALAWSTAPAIHYVVDVSGWYGPIQ